MKVVSIPNHDSGLLCKVLGCKSPKRKGKVKQKGSTPKRYAFCPKHSGLRCQLPKANYKDLRDSKEKVLDLTVKEVAQQLSA